MPQTGSSIPGQPLGACRLRARQGSTPDFAGKAFVDVGVAVDAAHGVEFLAAGRVGKACRPIPGTRLRWQSGHRQPWRHTRCCRSFHLHHTRVSSIPWCRQCRQPGRKKYRSCRRVAGITSDTSPLSAKATGVAISNAAAQRMQCISHQGKSISSRIGTSSMGTFFDKPAPPGSQCAFQEFERRRIGVAYGNGQAARTCQRLEALELPLQMPPARDRSRGTRHASVRAHRFPMAICKATL